MSKKLMADFAGGSVVENPPANAGGTDSISALGSAHMPSPCSATTEPRLQSLQTATTEASHRRACASQEKPPQWEAYAPQHRATPSPQLEKAHVQQQRPTTAKK